MTRRQRKVADRIDALLEEREALRSLEISEGRRYKESVALSKKQHDEALEGVPDRIAGIDAELAEIVKGRLYWILRWFSKTMRRPAGVITFVNQNAQLELPADVDSVIDALDKLPEGEGYIRIVKELDREAFAQAPESLLAKLRHLGVRRVPHDILRVRSLSDAKATQIARWEAAERTRRATPKRP